MIIIGRKVQKCNVSLEILMGGGSNGYYCCIGSYDVTLTSIITFSLLLLSTYQYLFILLFPYQLWNLSHDLANHKLHQLCRTIFFS